MSTGLADAWLNETGYNWGFIIEPPARDMPVDDEEASSR